MPDVSTGTCLQLVLQPLRTSSASRILGNVPLLQLYPRRTALGLCENNAQAGRWSAAKARILTSSNVAGVATAHKS